MTLYLSSLMSGMLTSKSGVVPDIVGTFCVLLETSSFGTAGKSFALALDGKGVVAERITDTRGFAGRLPEVNARGLAFGGSGADRGVVNVREALMLALKVGGDGVRPMLRSPASSITGLTCSSSSW